MISFEPDVSASSIMHFQKAPSKFNADCHVVGLITRMLPITWNPINFGADSVLGQCAANDKSPGAPEIDKISFIVIITVTKIPCLCIARY